jgi:hypothetical protein
LYDIREEGIIREKNLGCFEYKDNRVNEKMFNEWIENGEYDYVNKNEVEENERKNEVKNVDGNENEKEDLIEDIDEMNRHMLDDVVDLELDDVV